jgi:hypothetical protein
MADHRVAPEATTLRASATSTSAVGRVTLTTSANGIGWSVGKGVEVGDGLAGEEGDGRAVDEAEESGCGAFSAEAWQPASNTVTSAADAAGPLIRPA